MSNRCRQQTNREPKNNRQKHYVSYILNRLYVINHSRKICASSQALSDAMITATV